MTYIKKYFSHFVVLIALVVFIVWHSLHQTKIRYINFVEVYDGFAMKRELEESFKKSQTSQVRIMDSLKAELSVMSQKLQSAYSNAMEEEFEKKRQRYLYQQRTNESLQEEQMMQYKEQIIKRLRQYSAEYAKEKNIDVLLGQDEGFTNLYLKDNMDVTQSLLKYINEKYKGVR